MAAGTALAAMKSASKFGMGNNAMAMARAKKKQQQTPTNGMDGRIEGIESRITDLESKNEPAAVAAPVDATPMTGGFSPGAIDAASGVFGTEEERQVSVAPKPQILEQQEESASAQLGGLFADNLSYPGVGL
jgi:hypothetical protein